MSELLTSIGTSVLILLMRLNTRSLSALEANIDSSCNDKIQYSGKHADAISYYIHCTLWLALTLMFVLHVHVCR